MSEWRADPVTGQWTIVADDLPLARRDFVLDGVSRPLDTPCPLCEGRELTAGNSGALQWGPEYRTFHADAWARCAAVLRPGALLLVNVSDHIRKGSRVAVADWHAATLDALGLVAVERLPIPTPRLRYGANGAARVEAEELLVYRRPAKVAGL